MKNNLFYFNHIAEAVASIEKFIGDADYNGFQTNKMMVDAVIRELGIIGEAANNIGLEFRALHPEIPWDKMIDMRNFLIHEYFGVRADIVWDTVKNDLPELKQIISKILSS
jgi:uncharacterized protein with HEPN domain